MVDQVALRSGLGYTDAICNDKTARFRLRDDGGLGSTLTQEWIEALITSLDIDFTKEIKTRSFTLEVSGASDPVVLEMKVKSVKEQSICRFIAKIFKQIVTFLFGAKPHLTSHITREFRELVKKMPQELQQRILNDVRITKEEHDFLHFLGSQIDFSGYSDEEKASLFIQILEGAYVEIDDGGKAYDIWKTYPHVTHRWSSHDSSAPQYSLQGPLVTECLFSKKQVGNQERSWFQLERFTTAPIYLLAHLITWILYKITGKNQGPYGESPHTESHDPILLQVKATL